MTSPLTEGQREVVSRVTTLDGLNRSGAQSEAPKDSTEFCERWRFPLK